MAHVVVQSSVSARIIFVADNLVRRRRERQLMVALLTVISTIFLNEARKHHPQNTSLN